MMRDLPDRWHDLGNFIREQRSAARMSLRRLSELAGISNPYLSQIERGLRRPSAEILQQIAHALAISAETLYVRAGILEPRDGESDVAHAIVVDPYLTEDQKQALMRIYVSFRNERGAVTPSGSPGRTENEAHHAEEGGAQEGGAQDGRLPYDGAISLEDEGGTSSELDASESS
jgi:transcriptional regulator with XRE-family HTH domain